MYTIYHLPCKRPAMLYETKPISGNRIFQDKARHLDGTVFGDGELPRCGSCGMRLVGPHLIPDPNDIRLFDMSNDEDMQELYGPPPGVPGPVLN